MTTHCPKCKAENNDTARFCNNCAAPLQNAEEVPAPTQTIEAPREELTTGSTFADRYQIIEELGRGGMGKVYKATDTKIKEKVALKLIKPEIASDKKTLERFGNELKIARKIVHKNVGRMYDINEDKGTHYITMEYVSGQDLKGFIRQSGQMAIGTSISAAKQICEGLSEAHMTGVIHRDLKPSNIMIDREGNVRIMDFGIARSLKEKGITGAGVMIGTPEYMSPEQAEAKEVDQRSDIYSLGVILYEMVTGRVPFDGDTPLSIAMKHKGEIPKDPKEYNAQVPDDLSKLILKCMEKDKDNRFQSAGEIHSELENIEKGIPTTDRAIPKRKPLTSKEITVTFGLKKLLVPTLVFIGILAVGLVIWSPWTQKEPGVVTSDNPSVAILIFDDLSTLKDQGSFCEGMMDEIINKLSTINGLKVISRTTMMRYKDLRLAPNEIGQELNVEHILEGSVRREGDDIRVIASLINVNDESTVWSDSYDQKIESVFTIQSDIAQEILIALKARLSPGEMEQLKDKPTENLMAYEFYIQGRSLFYTYNKENNEQAIILFEKALELDPSFSLAYSGLSKCYAQYINHAWDFDEKWLLRGEETAKRAIELDRQSAEAYFALGFIHEQRKAYAEMEREMRNALRLNPNHAHAHDSLGDVMHRWHGNLEEALQELNTALTLDPFLLGSHWNIFDIYVKQGKYDDAEQILLQSLEKHKDNDFSLGCLGRLYRFMGEFESSIEVLKKALEINPQIVIYRVDIGLTYLLQNKFERAQAEAKYIVETLENNAERNFSYHYLLGRILLEQGDFQSAFQNFERALQINSNVDITSQLVYKGETEDIFKAMAEVYFRQGKFKEAIMELSRLDDLPLGSFQFENYMWALKHYKLGKIHEKMNNIETAKKDYEKFLDLWKDADPGIAEVEDARKKLAELQKSH